MVPFKKYMVPLSFSSKHIYYIWNHSKNCDLLSFWWSVFPQPKTTVFQPFPPLRPTPGTPGKALYPPLPMPCGRKLEVEICLKKGRKRITNSFFMVTRRGCFFLFGEGITVFKSFVYICLLYSFERSSEKQNKKMIRVVSRVKTCYFCLSSET